MNRTATFLAIATAALTLASAAGPQTDHADAKAKPQTKQQRCLTKGKTLQRSGSNRLYVVEKKSTEYYFACSARTGVHIPVFTIGGDTGGSPDATFSRDHVAIDVVTFSELDGEATGSIAVYDLRTGKKLGAAPLLGVGIYADNMGASPVLARDGRVAWIATAREDDNRVVEVRTLVGGVAKTLDSGPGIDLKSLKVQGSTVSWTKDGVLQSAAI